MLAEDARRHDPRHLGEPPLQHVALQLLQPARLDAAPVEPIARLRRAERLERHQGVHAAVAIVVARLVIALAVELPADPGLFQPLGIGPPVAPEDDAVRHLGDVDIVDHRPVAAAAMMIDRSGHQIEAVGAGRPLQRGMIGVAHGEGVGEREMIGDVGARQMPHGQRALGGQPIVVAAAIPGGMAGRPMMVEALHHREIAGGDVDRERRDEAALPVGLAPHRAAAGQDHRIGIGEAAHACHRPEIMIERPVLLHEDHDMLDIHDRAGGIGGRRRDRAGQRRAQQLRRGDAPGGRAQEGPARKIGFTHRVTQ